MKYISLRFADKLKLYGDLGCSQHNYALICSKKGGAARKRQRKKPNNNNKKQFKYNTSKLNTFQYQAAMHS